MFFHGRPFGDVDATRVKEFLLQHREDSAYANYISLIFGKRPPEELYDLREGPYQPRNVASENSYSDTLKQLRDRVGTWMKQTNDPRIDPSYDGWDFFPYYGKASASRD